MKSVDVPSLDHDAMMLSRFGHKVSPQGRLERRIVANLIAHMERAGWKTLMVDDGDEETEAVDMKSAMEVIFNLDECWLYFGNEHGTHGVYLTLGEGTTLVCDWRYSEGDADGFNAAMEAFDAEEFA